MYTKDEIHKELIQIAAQSPARKRKVGAIIVKKIIGAAGDEFYEIVSSGYNFNLDGGPCENVDGSTHDNVVHAEVSTISNLTDNERSDIINEKYNVVMFTTHPPCDGCKAALLAANIPYIVMGDFLKFDSGKPRMALVPASLGVEVAKVMTYGAKKYKVNNWRKVQSQEPYINALERHLAAYKNGEMNDPESGLSHMSHIACNAAFLLELLDKPLIQEDN